MALMDLLNQVVSGAASPEQHVEQVTAAAPQGAVAQGLADAFRSDQTPPIGDMVGNLFRNSNGDQRAGLLNQLIAAVGPGVLGGLAGGSLGRVLPDGASQVTPEQASKVSPDQVQQAVNQAEADHPDLASELGSFYAQHSGLIKTLGTAALAVMLARVKQHMAER